MEHNDISPLDDDDSKLDEIYQGSKNTAPTLHRMLDGVVQPIEAKRKRDDDRVSLTSGRDF